MKRVLSQFVTTLSPFLIAVTYVTAKSIKYFQKRSYRDFKKKVVTTVTGYKSWSKNDEKNKVNFARFIFGVVKANER